MPGVVGAVHKTATAVVATAPKNRPVVVGAVVAMPDAAEKLPPSAVIATVVVASVYNDRTPPARTVAVWPVLLLAVLFETKPVDLAAWPDSATLVAGCSTAAVFVEEDVVATKSEAFSAPKPAVAFVASTAGCVVVAKAGEIGIRDNTPENKAVTEAIPIRFCIVIFIKFSFGLVRVNPKHGLSMRPFCSDCNSHAD